MNIKNAGIILAHAFVGWALCFAMIGIGMAVTSQNNALIFLSTYFTGLLVTPKKER